MARPTTIYTCAKCDAQHLKWLGQCSECGGWGTISEALRPAVAAHRPTVAPDAIPLLDTVATVDVRHRPTGIAEFDLAIGGGLTPGSLMLLSGEPGIGKSTLILQVAGAVATPDAPVLYVTGEETAAQLRERAKRLGSPTNAIRVLATTDATAAAASIGVLRPSLVIVDSLQTIALPDLPADAGGVTQIRAIASTFLATAKATGVPVIAIGHVTKDGAIAGPKTLEHLVDQVAVLEGDPASDLRMLRTTKNRFGPTDVAGIFTMAEHGLVACADPGRAFATANGVRAPGTAIAVETLGSRTLLVELHALVAPVQTGPPQRRAIGIDVARLHVLLAVLAQHGKQSLANADVYLATSGGIRVDDPAADLAILAAIASARGDAPAPFDAYIGEVILNGQLRSPRNIERRIREAVRMGATRIAVPAGTPEVPRATLHRVPHVGALFATTAAR